MTFHEAVEAATAKLSSISYNAKIDARLLVSHICKIEQSKLIAHPELEISSEELTLFKQLLARRAQGEPLAYITGTKEFWSLDFVVNKHVLIPRPETELLVETTLDYISSNQAPRILELGTGSGAIATAIAKERNDCLVTATDISEFALEVAKFNASKHKVFIQFIHSDWYEKLGDEKFDVIVCNPPYVSKDDPNLHKYVTKFEPTEAIISNKNGFEDLEQVISGAQKHLCSHGHLLVEHGFQQANEVRQLFKQHNFNQVLMHKDLAGFDRLTSGQIQT